MIITLYKCSDDNSVVQKTLTNAKQITVRMLDGCPLLTPQFVVSEDIRGYNYMSTSGIDGELRYYFVEEPVIVQTGVYRISCTEDVLMTFRTEIYNINAYVTRYENGNKELVDSEDTYNSDTERTVTTLTPTFTMSSVANSAVPQYVIEFMNRPKVVEE